MAARSAFWTFPMEKNNFFNIFRPCFFSILGKWGGWVLESMENWLSPENLTQDAFGRVNQYKKFIGFFSHTNQHFVNYIPRLKHNIGDWKCCYWLIIRFNCSRLSAFISLNRQKFGSLTYIFEFLKIACIAYDKKALILLIRGGW